METELAQYKLIVAELTLQIKVLNVFVEKKQLALPRSESRTTMPSFNHNVNTRQAHKIFDLQAYEYYYKPKSFNDHKVRNYFTTFSHCIPIGRRMLHNQHQDLNFL